MKGPSEIVESHHHVVGAGKALWHKISATQAEECKTRRNTIQRGLQYSCGFSPLAPTSMCVMGVGGFGGNGSSNMGLSGNV